MKIEFLESGSDDCPLIRIYGNEPSVCEKLRVALMQLSNETADEVVVTQLQGIQPIDGCRLNAEAGDRDVGVIRTGANTFSWILTARAWEDVVHLIDPFCGTPDGEYQWIDSRGEIQVLLSTSGCW